MHHYSNIVKQLNKDKFSIPQSQLGSDYFPTFLKKKLNDFISYYETELKKEIDDKVPFDGGGRDVVISSIKTLSAGIINSVELYYQGDVFGATKCFNDTLNSIKFNEILTFTTLKPGLDLYRCRKYTGRYFSKEDLFHVPFEMRHIVSTNRYSIPGLPALYFGDSTYVCWEEFNRCKFRDLWFSKFQNVQDVRVLLILRYEDLIEELESMQQGLADFRLMFLLRYLATFPMTLACSIKVKEHDGNFKPEYIIPQLLLQFISERKDIDGIKFPSTKVDYSKLNAVPAYNYVFPVKTIQEKGFCSVLTSKFKITEPTSLEFDEVFDNPKIRPGMFIGGGEPPTSNYIEIHSGQKFPYYKTSFFRVEEVLRGYKFFKL